ncbi:MAG: cytochrome b [Halofilum sp. (in: g-proteobacteria)]|nr:cytochrome b [Halofilum sp. (in: g-proteobacteria)]
MRLRNTSTNWGAIAKLFHWLIALCIITNLGLGYWAEGLALSPTKVEAFYWHKSIGLTVLWLALLRLLWRFTNPSPRLPTGMAGWERALAHTSHVLLYALMIAMPLSGWIIHSAANFPLDLYGVFPVPDIVPSSTDESAIGDLAKAAHYWMFVAICVLLTLHVLGALKHHIVNRDDVLKRMLPFSRASDPIRGE